MAATALFHFDEAQHIYRDGNGVVIPSTTQVLKSAGLISFDHINQRVLEYKRQLGTVVHKVTEMWENGANLDEFEIPQEVWPYFEGYRNFIEDCQFKPRLVEYRQVAACHGMRWGMCTDRVGMINGVDHIIELKCGAAHPAHGVQLASYDMGINGKQKFQRASVQLGPDFPRGYKLFPWDDTADYQVWLSALACTIWKLNRKFALDAIEERLVA
jgi:hypothetical protein